MNIGWVEVAGRVYIRSHERWSLNVGLTSLPPVVVDTHAYVDHVLGNVAFRPASIWGTRAASFAAGPPEVQWANRVAKATAEDLAGMDLIAPSNTLADTATLDLGDRLAQLSHLGRGHTETTSS